MGDGKIALILYRVRPGERIRRQPRPQRQFAPQGGSTSTWRERRDAVDDLAPRHRWQSVRGSRSKKSDRLEPFAAMTIEWVAGRPLVQYRGKLLPLVDVAGWLNGGSWIGDKAGPTMFQIVIHDKDGKRFGLVFDRVLDIVEQRMDVQGKRPAPECCSLPRSRAARLRLSTSRRFVSKLSRVSAAEACWYDFIPPSLHVRD